MLYKNTSVKRVIAKVFTDFDLQEGDHRISDMVNWAGEALEKIGAFPSFVNKVTGKDKEPITQVANFQAKLPTDFHNLIQIAYAVEEAGPYYPMRTATGSFEHASQMNTEISASTSSVDADLVGSDNDLVVLAMSLYDLTYTEAIAKMNDEPDVRAILNLILVDDNSAANDSITNDFIYVIQNGWVKLNVREGYLMISYQAVPTDLDGYPMIPDDQSFMEAIYWYIVVKLLYPRWRDGQVRDAVYIDARHSWNFYCKQAFGKAMMMDIDQLEAFKNSWLRLIPDVHAHDTFFSTLGEREKIYNANR